jgi:hypothetical protein
MIEGSLDSSGSISHSSNSVKSEYLSVLTYFFDFCVKKYRWFSCGQFGSFSFGKGTTSRRFSKQSNSSSQTCVLAIGSPFSLQATPEAQQLFDPVVEAQSPSLSAMILMVVDNTESH